MEVLGGCSQLCQGWRRICAVVAIVVPRPHAYRVLLGLAQRLHVALFFDEVILVAYADGHEETQLLGLEEIDIHTNTYIEWWFQRNFETQLRHCTGSHLCHPSAGFVAGILAAQTFFSYFLGIFSQLLQVDIPIIQYGELSHFRAVKGDGRTSRLLDRDVFAQVEGGGPVVVVIQRVVYQRRVTLQRLLRDVVLLGIVLHLF